jgi:hypothetical protein
VVVDTPILDEIIQKLKSLPDNLQRQVLTFVKALQVSSIQGTPGNQLVSFAGKIPCDDLSAMKQAIETDCEQVDSSEW